MSSVCRCVSLPVFHVLSRHSLLCVFSMPALTMAPSASATACVCAWPQGERGRPPRCPLHYHHRDLGLALSPTRPPLSQAPRRPGPPSRGPSAPPGPSGAGCGGLPLALALPCACPCGPKQAPQVPELGRTQLAEHPHGCPHGGRPTGVNGLGGGAFANVRLRCTPERYSYLFIDLSRYFWRIYAYPDTW